MTRDSHLFQTRKQLESEGGKLRGNIFYVKDKVYLPLYEGKMVWHFDHRFAHAEEPKGGMFLKGSSEAFSVEEHKDPYTLPLPRYWLDESFVRNFVQGEQNAIVAFSVTRGIKLPARPGYRVLAVFQIAFLRSNLVAAPMFFQQSKTESASEANQIYQRNLHLRPGYGQILPTRPLSAVIAQPQVSLNASVCRPGYAAPGGH